MNIPATTCDWQTDKKKVRERGRHLLETGTWSDCKFIVGTEPNQQTIEGHKLFLAMSSPVFEAMFYGGIPESDPIMILDVQPCAFKALLEYIYTDVINLTSFDQACELCYGAKKYMLPHLVEECTKYMWSDLYHKNACRAYEFAKLFEEPILMDKSLNIICNETGNVLTHSSFEDCELNTVITIFEQEELNVSSELELFSALQRYACKNNLTIDSSGTCDASNRPTIRDALSKIRFLTLTPQQFADGPANSNLLTQQEKLTILMNICSRTTATPMPVGFSTVIAPRKKRHFNISNSLSIPGTSAIDLVPFPEVNNESDSSGRFYCTRQVLSVDEHANTSVLDCVLTFSCDKNIGIFGIKIPAQLMRDSEQRSYSELLYAHLVDDNGCRLTYTHFTSRVYKIGVVLNKMGYYPFQTCTAQKMSNGVMFTFRQDFSPSEIQRDGLIKSIIFSMSNPYALVNNRK